MNWRENLQNRMSKISNILSSQQSNYTNMVFILTFSLLGCKPLQFSCFTHTLLKQYLQCRHLCINPSYIYHLDTLQIQRRKGGTQRTRATRAITAACCIMGSSPFWETGSTLTPCSGSRASSGISSGGTASITGLRLTAVLQGAEVRKAKDEGQIAAGVKCHSVWFQPKARNYLPALMSFTHLYPVVC